MSKEQRCTQIEKEKRIFMVQSWMLEGVQDRLIIKQATNLWDVSIRQAERYVKEAYENWKKIEGVNIDMKREMAIARLKQKSRSLKSEFKGTPAGLAIEIAIEKEINKLEGLEPDKNININTGVKPIEFVIVRKDK